MHVMGLDISTHCGVAVIDSTSKEVLHSGEYNFPKLRGYPRIHAIASEILSVKDEFDVKAIVIEDYAVGRFAGSAIVSIELGAVIRFILWQEQFPFAAVSPSVVKKFVTGKGNAQKNLMLLGVFKRFGFSAQTDNIADAVALAHLGVAAITKNGHTYTKEQLLCADTLLKSSQENFLQLIAK